MKNNSALGTGCGTCYRCVNCVGDDYCDTCMMCIDCAAKQGTEHCTKCNKCETKLGRNEIFCKNCGICDECLSNEEDKGDDWFVCEDCGYCPHCDSVTHRQCYAGHKFCAVYFDYCTVCDLCEGCAKTESGWCDTCKICFDCAVKAGKHCSVCKTCLNGGSVCSKCGRNECSKELSGSVVSFLEKDGNVTIELWRNGSTAANYTTTVSGGTQDGNKYTTTYSFSNVPVGTYTMKVSKAKHATREYTVIVSTGTVTQNVEIHLMGDVNGDGIVTADDAQSVQRYVAGLSNEISTAIAAAGTGDIGKAEISYILKAANANGSMSGTLPSITAADAQEIQRYVAGLPSTIDNLC